MPDQEWVVKERPGPDYGTKEYWIPGVCHHIPNADTANLLVSALDLKETLELLYQHCLLYHPSVEFNNVGEAVRRVQAKIKGENIRKVRGK
jgi:hypothetical protein